MTEPQACAAPAVELTIQLTEDDVEGAKLDEPLEMQNVSALKRWLLCRGVEMPSSSRKAQLLERFV